MKHTLSQRDVDFMSALRHTVLAWNDTKPPTLGNAIIKVLAGPAPRFYVEYETAYRYVSLAIRDRLPHRVYGRRRQMWNDLAGKVLGVMSRGKGCSMACALVDVLENETAPSFYISYWWARKIYHRYLMLGRTSRNCLKFKSIS